MKRETIRDAAQVVLALGLSMAAITFMYIHEGKANQPVVEEVVEEEPAFFSQSPEEGLADALDYYEIEYPEIVYAQAVLETGHFKSDLCIYHNNLFGLYNSKRRRYFRFNHWTESVEAYRNMIQHRYKPPGDYYKFLQRINYAEDPQYIKKLKKLVKDYEVKQDASSGDNQQAGEGEHRSSREANSGGEDEVCPFREWREAQNTLG